MARPINGGARRCTECDKSITHKKTKIIVCSLKCKEARLQRIKGFDKK